MSIQEIREVFGKSIYEIWLDVAMTSLGQADDRFQSADAFIEALKNRPSPALKKK